LILFAEWIFIEQNNLVVRKSQRRRENIENELTQAKMIILKMIENNFYPQKFHIDHLIPSRHSSDLLLSSMQESSFWPPHTKRVNGVVVCKWSFIDTLGRHPEA
jgi:hypothetical protein